MADRELLLERLERLAIVLDELMPGCAELVRDALSLLKEQRDEIERLKGELHGFGDLFHTLSEKTEIAIADQPKVVRCKDCVHIGNMYKCPVFYSKEKQPDDWFCADGQLKE